MKKREFQLHFAKKICVFMGVHLCFKKLSRKDPDLADFKDGVLSWRPNKCYILILERAILG